MKAINYLFMVSILTFASFITPDATSSVKDYLSVSGPIEFGTKKFNLSWSSHPSDIYYKQEYLVAGDQSESFKQMIMLEALNSDLALREAVKSKTAELDQRKGSDPNVHYEVSFNKEKNEYLLDFLMSQTQGNHTIVEWNVYRYSALPLKSGKTGVLLFAYSKRGYDQGATDFLKNLKGNRPKDIAAFTALKFPAVKIVN